MLATSPGAIVPAFKTVTGSIGRIPKLRSRRER